MKSWKMASLCSFKERPLLEIRNYLKKFSGGSVDLIKRQDGLAVVLLNQENKKNAMSGKLRQNKCIVMINLPYI